MTAADLDQMANDYLKNVMGGGVPPLLRSRDDATSVITDAEWGEYFRGKFESDEVPEGLQPMASIFVSLAPDDAELGQHMQQMALCGLFERQLRDHQQLHQISGLLERPFAFTPLQFNTVELSMGLWLREIGNDAARLRQAAQRLAGEFRALADGTGRDWIRYRELQFQTEDGADAWRYVRDSWTALDAALQQADSANFIGGSWEIEGSTDAVLRLTVWSGGAGYQDGDAHSFLLVHPSLTAQLDDPDSWWC